MQGKGASWQKHGDNFPNAMVSDICYDAEDDVLVAGTYGRSAWLLPGVSNTVVPFDISASIGIEVTIKTKKKPKKIIKVITLPSIKAGAWTFVAGVSGPFVADASVSYKWLKNGKNVGNTLKHADALVPGDTIQCSVTVTDWLGNVATDDSPVVTAIK